jgi:putative peptidoglycan lipid II flippase
LFQYGALTERDVFMAARSLVAYSGGLTAFILIKILAPGFYARQDTRTPVKMGIIAMCTNIVLNLLFVVPLAHAGLALATSLAAFINAGLLLRVLLAEGTYRPLAGWPTFALKVALATAVMGAILVAASGSPQVWSDSGVSGRVLRLAGLVAMGAATYFAGVFALGIRPGDMAQPGREV